ncbi:rho GTPase-activating protein 44-like [Limulus polyphemus]|uniref:Rho GTPase-activating protein 44-like n=1 Tax=Limulus polyphemus TaxID=6850 RepID=A0ABM1SMH5_LIMPO|nr:rho GTPase-activating protein 44-like [Limulus polyphemus]
MKKQFLRVKQIADQTFLRAEKTEVLTEDLVSAEKRVELVKQSCQNTAKKVAGCLQSGGTDVSGPEKRLKKLREIVLSQCMAENSGILGESSILGIIFGKCASLQEKLGKEIMQYEMTVEEQLLTPIGEFLENDVPNITKLRKLLNKLTLDMDSARSRYQTAVRHSHQQTGGALHNSAAKADVLKEELEDASLKVEQCKDTLAAEMYALFKREPEFAQLFVDWYKYQADCHRKALHILEEWIPLLESDIQDFNHKPVYGTQLSEHLRVTGRQIASVIEMCICCLLENGMNEEGLFRIAGSASKVKKLKNSFDALIAFDLTEYARDPHTVAGALKSYLRELPEPLLTFDLYDEWMNAAKTVDPEARLQALWQVLHQLPEANRNNLRYIIKFLAKLATYAEVNKMSPQNIAIVFAPNLIWGPDQDSMQFGMNMSVANIHSIIVDSLVTYADWFFPGETNFCITSPPVSINPGKNLATACQPECPTHNEEESDPDQGGSPPDSLTTSPVANSPKPIHRPGKKPAPPAPGIQQKEKTRVSEKHNLERSISYNQDKQSNIHSIQPGSFEKLSSYDRQTSTLPRNIAGAPRKTERLSIIQRRSHENLSGIVSEKSAVTKTEKVERPEKTEKLLLYSTNSLDRKSKLVKVERPPLAPRHSKLSSHIEKPSVPPPGIPVKNSASSIDRPSVPPPERPTKADKLSKPVELPETGRKLSLPEVDENSENTNQKFSFSHTDTEPSLSLINDNTVADIIGHCEVVGYQNEDSQFIQLQKNSCEDTEVIEKPQQVATLDPGHTTKQDRWNFLTSQSVEKPPERPPRIIPPPHDTTDKDWGLGGESSSDLEDIKTCVGVCHQEQPPERPPRSNQAVTESSTNQPGEKPYCALIQVGGLGTIKVPSSPSSVRSKPPRPQPPPPPVKPKVNAVSEDTRL